MVRLIHSKLCKKLRFQRADKWHENKPVKVLESKECKILLDFPLQPDKNLENNQPDITIVRSSRSVVFLRKGVLKICRKIYRRTLMQKCDFNKVAKKRYSENMQRIYRITPIPKCDFNKVVKRFSHFGMDVLLLHVLKTSFLKNTSGRLFLNCRDKNWYISDDWPILSIRQPNGTEGEWKTKQI